MGRIRDIGESTESEREQYLDHLGWDENPFLGEATIEEYVLPGGDEIADLTTALDQYTGPLVTHSPYSGAGKTTLLKMLMEEYEDEFQQVYIGEHNVTAYELTAIIADSIGVGKSSSTKLTERKLTEHEYDQDVLLAIDEIGLNDSETIHTIQRLNDLTHYRVVLTGMTSQWEAIGQQGAHGKAFQRRASIIVELEPLTRKQTEELVKRRIASVTGYDHANWQRVPLEPFTDGALDVLHEKSKHVPGVMVSALSDAFGLAAWRYAEHGNSTIDEKLLRDHVNYSDPVADTKAVSD